nr:hypothetical protein [Tanacetum cinerariifolium]
MKEIFEEIEAKVDQNVVDRKCDEIKRKNLLIVNENLIANWLTHEVFYTATDSVLSPAQDAPEIDSFFEISRIKASLHRKDNTIRALKAQISQMKERHSEADRILDIKALETQNIDLTGKVTALLEQNKPFRTENAKIKQHYKELYVLIPIE